MEEMRNSFEYRYDGLNMTSDIDGKKSLVKTNLGNNFNPI